MSPSLCPCASRGRCYAPPTATILRHEKRRGLDVTRVPRIVAQRTDWYGVEFAILDERRVPRPSHPLDAATEMARARRQTRIVGAP